MMARPIFCYLADPREIPWPKHGRALRHYHYGSESQILRLSRSSDPLGLQNLWGSIPVHQSGWRTVEEIAHPCSQREHRL
ncbi:hypothetical protein NL676_033961 [Syzygium grande]|nr:hypothetical protein NL676_033961 [Syzygium grande]